MNASKAEHFRPKSCSKPKMSQNCGKSTKGGEEISAEN